jgi:prevent-host-death family protein
MSNVTQVEIRALKQNASAVVAQAAAGEKITITDRGRPVAEMTPLPSSPLKLLIMAGRARPPHSGRSPQWGPRNLARVSIWASSPNNVKG